LTRIPVARHAVNLSRDGQEALADAKEQLLPGENAEVPEEARTRRSTPHRLLEV
jgi:hypothetical protein